MANTVIQLKHSTLTGNVPSSLANGEISINNRDGKFFYSTPAGAVITHYPYLGPAGLNKEVQFNDSGVLGSSSGLAFDKISGSLNVSTSLIVSGRDLGAYANAAFLQANTPSATANSAALYANAAFTRANNSLDANNGGTVTGTITATSFITTGSFGNITGANTIYANNFVANTGFIQFADGSKQYTANAGSGGDGGNSFGQIVANGGTILATTSNDSIQIIGESGITVTSNVSAKKVIVSVPAGFTFTTADYGFVTDSTNVIYDYGTI
jgi:hypothetical protein